MTSPACPGAAFLPSWLYHSQAIALRERSAYASRCWHPVAAVSELEPGQALATEVLGLRLVITRPTEAGEPLALINRCPHRGVALLEAGPGAVACKRLVCPYHGWTYDLEGRLLAAARESDFMEDFDRSQWPLQTLPARAFGPWIWVALSPSPIALEEQLDLVLDEAGELFRAPRQQLLRQQRPLDCNWKIAHDNTLDDYHVAIAHPTTLHREQGPVRDYRHALGRHGNLLATPVADGGTFYTFGLCPWTHLLLWPDQRLALISFLPTLPMHGDTPSAVNRCVLDVWLLGPSHLADQADVWMAEIQRFLEEDRQLVESAQRAYETNLTPGPAHRLEQRILQWQTLYRQWMNLESLPADPTLSHATPFAAMPPSLH